MSTQKTIRLLYPDFASGAMDTYWFGAKLLVHVLPENSSQELVEVEITPPDGSEGTVEDGLYERDAVVAGLEDALAKLEAANPDRVITLGGNCMVSQAPFDYLHGKYPNTGIVWIDSHPDVSIVGSPHTRAHAMVLASLLGKEEGELSSHLRNEPFKPSDVLYVGLRPMHEYEEEFLQAAGIEYHIQESKEAPAEEILAFMERFEHILVHFDIDVMNEHTFHATYFANPALQPHDSSCGVMEIPQVTELLKLIDANADVAGFTIAEYLPFDEQRLNRMFSELDLFTK